MRWSGFVWMYVRKENNDGETDMALTGGMHPHLPAS